ncbi:UDP-N-acetyl glucosamine 2-epimerase [Dissulfurispira thermophila]|uniref:UDP-N-acetyl glucosamine 2-epimerase n=1 Tax=Dissulfurispira thermophila TaxID=2715679 RepID=A0A7G1H1I1_9BACT|nr:UDP-N-acetylglucosamine 2-epimerase [Dissulfurispira thermophila]BCB96069.1 UDP-N-acetyl glucosamine 2-epimerase [Dissulfurispira thermophila]
MKRKICIVLTVRGNYAKMKSIMREIKNHSNCELQLVVGGAVILHKFGNPVNIIEADGFEISEMVHFLVEGGKPITMAKSTGLAVVELSTVFENLRPDIVMAIADRFEALAVAVAASYMNIPVAHLEGGELSGSIDESIRHAITKLSHIHFVATQKSKERVIKMGEDPQNVYVVGSPTIDLIRDLNLDLDFDVFEKYGGVGAFISVTKNNYIVVSQHPVTTEYEQAGEQIQETLHAINDINMPTLWLWPNMDAGTDEISKGIRKFREKYQPSHIHFFKNFAFEDYAKLINNAAVLVGNTSSGIRESAYLGVPVVNIGTRQNYRERGENVIDVGYNKDEIKEAIKKQIAHGKYSSNHLYGDGHAGEKIAEILSTCKISVQKRLMY